MTSEYEPTEVSPPGATIADLLEECGISQAQLAERMGLSVERVSALIEGRVPIGRDVAVGLERVLGVSGEFWIRRGGGGSGEGCEPVCAA